MKDWCLERVAKDDLDAIVPIARYPFIVGRDATCDLVIASSQTSRQHARIVQDANKQLQLTDLNSGNGTFVNHTPIQGTVIIADGDVVHFGATEFRVRSVDRQTMDALTAQNNGETIMFLGRAPSLSENFVIEERQFVDMLNTKSVRAAFQPIVNAKDGRLYAFEVLGRGSVATLPKSPNEMFALATRLGKEIQLSEAFRWAGLSDVAMLSPNVKLFVNAHPKEMFTEAFYQSITALRTMAPKVNLVVEVHETAVAQIDDVRLMAARLATMNVRFAYDDFGAGQARLLELAEVPPHYVKFDMGLIRHLDTASVMKQQLINQLVRIVHDVGAIALAEGVETAAEARACIDIGFDLIQGYFAGKPTLAEDLSAHTSPYVSQALREVIESAGAGSLG